MPPTTRTAALVLIGNELLSGKIKDTNSPLVLRELRALGVEVRAIHVLPDEKDVIAADLRAMRGGVDILLTSGGIGPTHDDVTLEAVATATDRPRERSDAYARALRQVYGPRFRESLLVMADVPRGAVLHRDGGLFLPVVQVENIWILPGEPTFFRRKFLAVKDRFRADPFHLRRLWTLLEEGDLAGILQEVERRFPGVQIGSYPVYGDEDYKVQVTVEAKDAAKVEQAFADLRGRIPPEALVREA